MQRKFSRRHFLHGAAALAGGAGLTVAASQRAQAQAKVSQTVVHYQATPKGSQRCDNCKFFEPPNACKLVQGPISPSGWCTLWAKP